MNYIIYLTSLALLFIDAFNVGDVQAWMELLIYAAMFSGALYFVELVSGVKAIQALNRTYPYDDKVLAPSLFYKFGILKHTKRERMNSTKEAEPDADLPD